MTNICIVHVCISKAHFADVKKAKKKDETIKREIYFLDLVALRFRIVTKCQTHPEGRPISSDRQQATGLDAWSCFAALQKYINNKYFALGRSKMSIGLCILLNISCSLQ